MRRLKALWLASIVLLLFTACGGDSSNDDGGGNKPTPASSGNSFVMGVKLTRHDVTTVVESDSAKAHTSYINTWGESSKAQIIGKQGDLVEDFGSVTVKSVTENVLGNFEVDLSKSQLNTKNSIDYYGFFSGMKGGVKDGRVYYDASQRRGFAPGYWFKASSNSTTATAQLCGVTEILYITNKTSNQILVTHNGFDTDEKWYYPKALIDVADNSIFETGDGNEVTTTGQFIAPNVMKSIITTYAPTGKAINNAQLICNISGTVVHSVNRISSDIVPQIGHIYAIYATWDGENLVLGDGDENTTNGVIELPANSNISMSDITIYSDGEEINKNSNGGFSANGNNLIAVNKNDQIVYINRSSISGNNEGGKVELNAKETAISLLLNIFPGILMPNESDKGLLNLKNLIGGLSETGILADAINKSISKNGYLEMDDINAEYKMAKDRILTLTGLDKLMATETFIRSRRRARPEHNPTVGNDNSWYYKGIRIKLENSVWEQYLFPWTQNVIMRDSWRCTFTAINDNRFAYTGIYQGYRMPGEDYATPYPNSFNDQTAYLVKPMKVSSLMDNITSWQYLEDLLTLFFTLGTSIGEETWDKSVKSNIEMHFITPTDVIIVAGPNDSENIYLYNLAVFIMAQATSLFLHPKETDTFIEKFYQGFISYCLKDTNFYIKISNILYSADSNINKAIVIFDLLFEKLANYMWDFDKTFITSNFYEWYKDNFRMKAMTDILKANKMNLEKQAEKVFDMVTFFLGVNYEGSFYVPISLDFTIPSGTLEDIPGEHF